MRKGKEGIGKGGKRKESEEIGQRREKGGKGRQKIREGV